MAVFSNPKFTIGNIVIAMNGDEKDVKFAQGTVKQAEFDIEKKMWIYGVETEVDGLLDEVEEKNVHRISPLN